MEADLRIRMLGGFRADLDGRPVPDQDWRRNKAKAMVKLLALTPGHQLPREELAEALWPELSRGAASSNLRKATHFARRAIGPARLKTNDDLIGLDSATLLVDVDAFEAAAVTGQAQEAIDLYGGELLPEDRFEPWTEAPRERLRVHLRKLLWQRAIELEAAGELRSASSQLERLVAEDPYDEEAHLALMRLYALGGRRHRAVHVFQELEKRLGDELGIEPNAAGRRLLREILSGHLSTEPAALARAASVSLAAVSDAERKPVTVLVAGITAATGSITASGATGRSLRSATATLVKVLREGGALVDASGNSVISATFGVPRVREDDQRRALLAGLEILRRAGALNQRLEGRGLPAVEVRVGISSGHVQVERHDGRYQVTGEALEAANATALCAPAGAVLVGDGFRRSRAWRIRFGETVRISREHGSARRLLSVGDAPRQRARTEPRFVGREAELGILSGLFDEVVRSGAPRFVLITGAAGIGKSRLLQEATRVFRARLPVGRELSGRCAEVGHGITHSALADIVKTTCSVSVDDSLEAVRAKLQDGLAEALAPLHLADADLAPTIAALASTAGVSLPASALEEAQPGVVSEEQARAWTRFASAVASAGPTLMLLEDLHWGTERLLFTLERVMRRCGGPLLVLATARPEITERWPDFGSGNERFSSLSLRRLTEAHSETLLTALHTGRSLGRVGRRRLLARAEGNPYFLQELVSHVEDRVAGGDQASGPDQDLPATLEVLLAARIDSLPPASKRVLQEASVLGRVFWAGPLTAKLGGAEVSEPLNDLERRGFIIGQPSSTLSGQEEFIFSHALLHEAAYASVPTRDRLHAHVVFGAWLETLAGQGREEVVDLLAFHFAAAIDHQEDRDITHDRERIRSKAFDYLLAAGTLARKRDAIEKAIDLHLTALRHATLGEDRMRAAEELGDDHDAGYHGDAALGFYETAMGLAGDDPAARSRLCWKSARSMAMSPGAFSINPDPDRAEGLVAEGLAVAPDSLARSRLLVVRGALARLYRGSEPFGQGQRPDPEPIEDRIGAVSEAIQLAQSAGQPLLLASARSALGILYGLAGRYVEMKELAWTELREMDSALPSVERADILRRVAVNTINIDADFEEGLALARRCYGLSRDSNPHQIMHATWPILVALHQLGRWQEMDPILEEHLAALRAEPALQCQFVRDGPVVGAIVATLLGDRQRAKALAALVADTLREPESVSAWQSRYAVLVDPEVAVALSLPKVLEGRTYGPQHCIPLLEALVVLKDWKGIDAHASTARAAAGGNALVLPFVDRAEGARRLAAGDLPGGRKALRMALLGFEKLKVPFEAALTRERLAAVEPPESASSLTLAAAEAYDSVGAVPFARAARAALGSDQL